jgi:hypothetical protein
VAAFKLAYGAKFVKTVAKITDDLDELLAFYDFPAEHWVHLRTTPAPASNAANSSNATPPTSPLRRQPDEPATHPHPSATTPHTRRAVTGRHRDDDLPGL